MPLSGPQGGRWHAAVLAVVEDVRAQAALNVSRFHLSQQRTGLFQDWVVAFGWEGARCEQGWLLEDAALIGVIDNYSAAIQRKCRRLVEQHGLKERLSGEGGRGAAGRVLSGGGGFARRRSSGAGGDVTRSDELDAAGD